MPRSERMSPAAKQSTVTTTQMVRALPRSSPERMRRRSSGGIGDPLSSLFRESEQDRPQRQQQVEQERYLDEGERVKRHHPDRERNRRRRERGQQPASR